MSGEKTGIKVGHKMELDEEFLISECKLIKAYVIDNCTQTVQYHNKGIYKERKWMHHTIK